MIAAKCEHCGGPVGMNTQRDWRHLLTGDHNCPKSVTVAEPHEFTDEECAQNIRAVMRQRRA